MVFFFLMSRTAGAMYANGTDLKDITIILLLDTNQIKT
jgi:hypothetical protein